MYEICKLNKTGGYKIYNKRNEVVGCYKNTDIASEHHAWQIERVDRIKQLVKMAIGEENVLQKDEILLSILRC